MQLSIKHYLFLFFLFSFGSASAQWLEPFSSSLPSENYFFEESAEKDIFSQEPFSANDYYSFSGDLLTNIFSQNNLLNDNALLLPPGTTMPNAPAIAGIPLGNGNLFLVVIVLFYLSILLIKKQKLQMKKIKIALFVLSFLTLCSGNSYAQFTLEAIPDNLFVHPGSANVKLDILHNDELGACTKALIEIELMHLTTSKGGTVGINSDNTIDYTPAPGFVGQDEFYYKISCGGESVPNAALVLINVSDMPDNIQDVCAIPSQKMTWGIDLIASSIEEVFIGCSPLVGNLDGDPDIEIVAMNNVGLDGQSNKILIFSYDELHSPKLYKKYEIAIPNNVAVSGNPLVIAKIEGDSYPSIFLTTNDATHVASSAERWQLIKYTFDGVGFSKNLSFGGTGSVTYGNSTNNTIHFSACSPLVADFMGIGRTQVVVYDKVFDAQTGALLVSGIDGKPLGTLNYNFGIFPHNGNFNNIQIAAWMAADIDNDGILEIVAGNSVYKINISNPNALVAGNTYTMYPGFTPPAGVGNGTTSIADLDGDGFLDVVTTWRTGTNPNHVGNMAVYNPRTGALLSQIITNIPANYIGTRYFGPAVPFIGDITGNGRPDIAFVAKHIMMAYKYDSSQLVNNRLSLLWDLEIVDSSASTGLTLFDFNQDGISEIVYRDEQNIRIINGSGIHHETGAPSINPDGSIKVYDLYSAGGVQNATVGEYATIAAITNDGQAKIITVGGGSTSITAPLRIFATDDYVNSPWAPARPVWDKYHYNPVYINEDLTIPAHPMNPATSFVDEDGVVHRPFNNFLQQATLLNNAGKMFRHGPDLTFDETFGSNGATFTIVGNDYEVDIWVTNEGDASFPTPLTVSAYGFTGTELVKLSTTPLSITIPGGSIDVGETKKLTFFIPNSVASFIPANIQLRLNEFENVFPVTMEECRYWNNYYNRDLWGAPDQILCEGDSTVYFYPLNSPLDYVWWTDPTSISSAYFLGMNKGKLSNSDLFVKDGTGVQSLYVDVYEGGAKRTTSRIEVKIYQRADSLIWTGAGGTRDWHNAANWINPDPSSPTISFPQSWIPRSCTNVLIPDGIDIYPNLSPTTTNRMVYSDAACNNIHFEFGGEVARTDSLHYSKAFVQYNFGYYDSSNNLEINDGYESINNPSHLERNRWYALATPLKKMVTGDFSFGGKPHTWQQGFVASNASGTWTGNWELPKNTNDLKLDESLNYAIALWTAGNLPEIGAENSQGYQNGLNALNGVLTIPYFQGSDEDAYDKGPHRIHKYDGTTSHFSYYWQYMPNVPLANGYPEGSIARGDEAYRFIFDKQVVNVGGKNTFKISVPARKEIMIGNPFMSTLNFDAFFAANGTSKIGSIYYRLFEDEVWTEYIYGTNTLIAPLQGFFLQTAGIAGTNIELEFPFEDVSITRPTGTEHLLKSSTIIGEENHLYVTATNKEKSNSIQLILNDDNENNIYKLFNPEAKLTPQIYFTDENNQKNAIQFVDNSTKKEILLGLSLPAGHRVDLSFSNLENLQIESLYLLDKQTGTRQDLFNNPIYTFLHADMNDYTERFVLEVGAYNPTYIDHIQKENNSINIYQTNENITISAKEKINRIELFDLQGQKIQQANEINNNIYQMNTNLSTGIYLIKTILMNGESQTDKIIIR